MIGNRIKFLRIERNLTQTELGAYLNISQKQISKYELNQLEPNIEMIIKLCKFFDVSADYLLGLSDY